MRLIDADELMEHVYRDKLDSRELIAEMIENAPTVTKQTDKEVIYRELKAQNEYLERQNSSMKGQIKALAFAVRCNGISGSGVHYEID